MKFTLVALSSLFAAAVQARNCITTVDPNTDYFPNKVSPTVSEHWDIEYFKTYKVVTNKAASVTYLLYQCGSEPPAEQLDGRHAEVLEIPLKEVGLAHTPMITFMEQLGLRDAISAFLTDPSYINSPCFAEDVASGKVTVLAPPTGDEDPMLRDNSTSATADMAAFLPATSTAPFEERIFLSESSETTNAGTFEWVKYYSVFFNAEKTANAVFDAAEDRWNCIAGNAQIVESDFPKKPVVLWGFYSDYCAGWFFARCPNFYCEFAEACSADILSANDEDGSIESALCESRYMTLEEFTKFGKDADYWIFPGYNWNATYQEFGETLNTFRSVQKQEVYDFLKEPANGWFEQRFAEYYDVLDDFCMITGTSTSFRGRLWFRNVFNEDLPTEAECNAAYAANILNDNHQCIPRTSPLSSSAFAIRTSFLFLVLAIAVAVVYR